MQGWCSLGLPRRAKISDRKNEEGGTLWLTRSIWQLEVHEENRH
jgi:hypothetical protein